MRTAVLYDGSFQGFLSAIFESYDRKFDNFIIVKTGNYQPELGDSSIVAENDIVKSTRVWTGLKKRLSVMKRNEFYKTFLSELPEMERALCEFVKYAFSTTHAIDEDLAHPAVITITKIAKQVHREKHRMEAFVRFQRTKDDLYFSSVSPDFNVLPLIVSHFKDRYADQHWLIYDNRRKYGIHYDRSTYQVTEVEVNLLDGTSGNFLPGDICHEDEIAYQKLWKDYFYSVNIGARKNNKLHVRHVPTRYWRYLTEKRDFT